MALVDGLETEDPFGAIAELTTAVDLMTVNVESTITEPDVGRAPVDKDFLFRAPPGAVQVLTDAGVDVAGLANNHVWDFGKAGTIRTVELLDAGGLAHVGAGADPTEAYEPLFIDVKGVTVGFASFSRVPCNWSFGGDTSRPQVSWACDPFAERVDALVARVVAESDVAVVLVHWGEEYEPCPEQDRRALAARWADLGVDLIVGSHPHVLQGMEKIGDTWVLYSLGNLVLPTARGEDRTTSAMVTYVVDPQLRQLLVTPLRLDERGRPRPAVGEEIPSVHGRIAERSRGATVATSGVVEPSPTESLCDG